VTTDIDAALLIYHHGLSENAPTIKEHVDAFTRYTHLPVFALNSDRGLPRGLGPMRFRALILHYSIFSGDYYLLSAPYRRFLKRHSDRHLITFFQDEHRFCRRRFDFLNRYDVETVYTLLEPEYHQQVYGAHTGVSAIHHTLTGYVSDELIDIAKRFGVPDDERAIDIGYRARQLAYYQGRGAMEKHEIGDRFEARASGLGLHTDIDSREGSRLYGDDWYRFVASCRGMLGVESGTSVFDLDDSARERTEALLAEEPNLSFDEVARRVLHEYEDKIYYRTVSPRHFEAAAFRVVQILYRGRYSGVMEPDVHYLALEKDFSNFDSVMARFSDPAVRKQITDRAYDDLIASGQYTYGRFMAGVDDHLASVGVAPTIPSTERRAIERAIRRGSVLGRLLAHLRWFIRNVPFPGRRGLAERYRKVRQALEAR